MIKFAFNIQSVWYWNCMCSLFASNSTLTTCMIKFVFNVQSVWKQDSICRLFAINPPSARQCVCISPTIKFYCAVRTWPLQSGNCYVSVFHDIHSLKTLLPHRDLKIMTDILLTAVWNIFSWVKITVFWFRFYCNLFLKIQLIINQHRLGWWLGSQATWANVDQDLWGHVPSVCHTYRHVVNHVLLC